MISRTHLTIDGWDRLVRGWNKLRPAIRRERAAICLKQGHVVVESPVGKLCSRCLTYLSEE